MIGSIRKIGLSLVLAGVLGVNANALCILENYCEGVHVGVGGFYENTDTSGANINRSAGFIAIGARDLFLKRINLSGEIKVGYGNTNISGTHLSQFNKNENLLYIELMPKIGFNLLKGDSQLFINLFAMSDVILASRNGVGRLMLYMGPEIEGRLRVSEKVKLTYSFGYGYAAAGYVFGGSVSRIHGYNQAFLFSLGIQTKISENVGFYIKGLGKYYDLNASEVVNPKGNNSSSISMPKSNGWQAGLEAGIAF